MMLNVKAIQTALKASKLDGWLFFDHHHRDPIAGHILGLNPGAMVTRRWFYYIPSRGEPRMLVHRIEAGQLDSLPGRKTVYSGWEELHKGLAKILGSSKTIAMQYSPDNNIPYIGLVDAGTIELIRKLKKKVVSSADLVQQFEATWSDAQLASHLEAGKRIDLIRTVAFERAASFAREDRPLREHELQAWILEQFRANGIVTSEPPIVAVQPNNGNPHYEPNARTALPICAGDLLLLDIWGKLEGPDSVYYDITWVGYLGERAPEKYTKIFNVVRQARDRAAEFVMESVARGKDIRGWQVDRVARESIQKAGYGKYFVHRTGHSIGRETHGNGANMDSLETRDDRHVVPRTCFSIEPGIYLPEFGVRLEVNMYVGEREARLTGAVQTEMVTLPV